LLNQKAVSSAVKSFDPEIIFHLGAYTNDTDRSFDAARKSINANIIGTVNLLEAACDGCSSLSRFVNVSTNAVYGPENPVPFKEGQTPYPPSPYSVSKYSAELFCNSFHKTLGLPVVNLRPFNPYGPAQRGNRIIPYAIISAMLGLNVKITGGRQTREFNHISDIVEGMLLSATVKKAEGRTLNLGSGVEISVRKVVDTVLKKMGNPVDVEAGSVSYRPNEIWRMYCDYSLSKRILGWKPKISLDAGLDKTIVWYQDEFTKNKKRFLKLKA
jgi:nucleoside-diphosphate-sugar epimerase